MKFNLHLFVIFVFFGSLSSVASPVYDAGKYIELTDKHESVSQNYRTVKLNDNFIGILKSSLSAEFDDFPLATDLSFRLSLERTHNIFDGKTKFFKGNQSAGLPDFATFKGMLDKRPDSKVIITISDGFLFGMFSFGGNIIYLSPSQNNDNEYILTDSRFLAYPRFLNHDDSPDSFENIFRIIDKLNSYDKPLSSDLLELELALETDTEFFKATGSDFKKAEAYILTLMTQLNMIYEEFINVRVKLTWLKIWTDSPADPYNAKGDYAVLRDKAVQYWSDNYQDVERDLYHVCTSINYGGGGFGYFDALCGKKQFGMSVSSLQGWNNLPTFDFSYDLYIIAHEIGHNFNAQHTHSCFWNNAPLDTCVVDYACLPQEQQPLPNPGSIMSYCGGINNQYGFGYRVRMIFLPGNIELMRKTAEAALCLSPVSEPVLTLLTPHGSEQFTNASAIDITWKAYNTGRIDIQYSDDAGSAWKIIASQVDADSGKYVWTLPKICSNKMLVKISSFENPDISSTSLLTFTVTMEDPDGLVAFYPFNANSEDEQQCHFYDAVNINNAQLVSDRSGNSNSAYSFNGTNYLRADNFNMSFDALTVSFWFWLDNADGKQNLVGSNYAEGWVFDSYYWGQLGVSFYVDGKGVPDQIWGGWLNAKQWYFGAFTFDGKKARVYVDGIMKGEKVWDSTVTLNKFLTPLYIGSRKDADFMNGNMDDIRIYKRALSESEILGLTGVQDLNNDENELSISPNPASEYIEINVPRWRGQGVDGFSPSEKRGSGGVSIFDLLGMEITTPSNLTPSPSPGGEGSKVLLDVSHLSPGVYFVRFGDLVRKFMKI